jgi:hypothetical protein
MSRRKNPAMPATDFGFLLVEGGDEESVCRSLAGPAWSGLCCWKAEGREDLPNLARLARNDPNFRYARSAGIVLDMESDATATRGLTERTLEGLGAPAAFVHGSFTGSPRAGAFLAPDGVSLGAIELLCRRAVRDTKLSVCVDQLIACAGNPHAAHANSRAAEDKGWLKAYLGMTSKPDLRFYQAFDAPQGIDPMHPAFAPLRAFILSL